MFLIFYLLSVSSFSQINFNNLVITGIGPNLETVDVGDVNNDCLNDVVVGSFFNTSIFIFLQNAQGDLNPPIYLKYSNKITINNVKIADIDHDLLNDILITCGDTLKIFYQGVDGLFTRNVNFYSGHSISDLDVGDLNNDGLPDIVLSHKILPFIHIYYQDTDHNFSMKAYRVPNPTNFQLVVNDFNNDGLKDIISLSDGLLIILYQSCSVAGIDSTVYGSGYPDQFSSYTLLNGIDVGYLGDVRGNNSIAISTGGNKSLAIVVNQNISGDPNAIPTSVIKPLEVPYQVKITDFDNDGKNEIAIAGLGWEYIAICERMPDYTYQFMQIKNDFGDSNPKSMAVGDINNDGLADIVYVGHDLWLHYNTSNAKGNSKEKSITNFSSCQHLINETITGHDLAIRTVTGIENNCPYIKSYQREVFNQYLAQKGVGDSVIIKNNCVHNIDTIKRNQLVYKKNILIKSDTSSEVLKDTKYTFPQGSTSISGPNVICASHDPVAYQVINKLNTSNTWYYLTDSLTVQNANLILSIPGIYPLIVKESIKVTNGVCATFDTLNIQVIPNALIYNQISGNDTVCGETQQIYSISKNENSVYAWTVSGASFIQHGTNEIVINFPEAHDVLIMVEERDKNACIGPLSSKDVIIKKITDCLFVPNVFTPNEDHINDFFQIKNIYLYPNNKLSVYNRWGSKVFESENYDGTWKAENIPDGIYYFSFEVNQKQESKGWVQIIR